MSLLHLRRKKRLIFAFFVFFCSFIILAIRLTLIQAFDSIDLTDKKMSQLMGEIPITASRGDIYDRNMNVLAKDASSSSIYARPKDISNVEEISSYLSNILDIDKQIIINKISDKSQWLVLIKRKVDNDVAFQIRDSNLDGIEIAEDKKRYYTNGNFASYVLGFTGSDHQGLYGVESVYDDVLKGRDGVLIFEKDGKSQKIPSGSEMRIEPISGKNIVLTIDSIVQHFTENAIEKTLKETNAKRAIAIVMDVNTGEILSMATKPDYDLNNPRLIADEIQEKLSVEMEGKNLGEKQLIMWENPAVSFNYEPGSTFKVITSSAALEDGVVTPDTHFYCNGYTEVAGVRIKCHIYPRSHGSQTFTEAVRRSCNPALVETILLMGPDIFYKYVYNYGFGDKTGIQLDGEQQGIVPPNENLNIVDFATRAFGQGISVTPIQLITAISASVNGGKLYQPSIIKEVYSSDNKEIVKDYKPELIRQVISKDTSNILVRIMGEVVSESANLSRYITDYNIGGKTGTAQKIVDGRYQSGVYVTSFYGFGPLENPQYAVLMLIDEPHGGSITGSTTAAPAVINLLNNILQYYDAPAIEDNNENSDLTIIPDLRNQSINVAKEILNNLGIKYNMSDNTEGIVVDQNLKPGSIYDGTEIQLTISENSEIKTVVVPNLLDMTIQQANQTLLNLDLKLKLIGSGIAQVQNPKPGEIVNKGSEVEVKFYLYE